MDGDAQSQEFNIIKCGSFWLAIVFFVGRSQKVLCPILVIAAHPYVKASNNYYGKNEPQGGCFFKSVAYLLCYIILSDDFRGC